MSIKTAIVLMANLNKDELITITYSMLSTHANASP